MIGKAAHHEKGIRQGLQTSKRILAGITPILLIIAVTACIMIHMAVDSSDLVSRSLSGKQGLAHA
jgi:hypothetical protein